MIVWLHTILYDSCFGVDYYTPETRDVHAHDSQFDKL